jgi:hypothetical protein
MNASGSGWELLDVDPSLSIMAPERRRPMQLHCMPRSQQWKTIEACTLHASKDGAAGRHA